MERVAILGAGVAGLTTALELSATPELRERYQVTVYQAGWRAGGKCTTGRNPDAGNRIEEHGLHLWFGGYDNAFRLLADCYRELDRPTGAPLATIDEAWQSLPSVVLYDHYDETWSPCVRTYDVDPGNPWDPVPVPRFWDFAVSVVHGIEPHIGWFRSTAHPARQRPIGPVARMTRRAGDAVESVVVRWAGRVLDRRHRRDASERHRVHPVARALEVVRDTQWRRHVRDHLDDPAVRDHFSQVDIGLTTLIGLIRDELLWKGFGAVDDEEFSAWLTRHGARPSTLVGPDVRVVYDQCFAGNIGPETTAPDPAHRNHEHERGQAAGAALYGMVRTRLPYRGSVMWRARGGMGDTAIAPMYQTALQRGVRFEFFRSVTDLGVDADELVVDRIDVLRQAEVVGDRPYDPLVDVAGLPCWPNRPQWGQLVDGDALSSAGIRFELGEGAPGAVTQTLRRGEDFDRVVLAISAAALPPICGEVRRASPAFDEMLRHTTTIMTQAFQVWLDEAPADLGFPYGDTATSTFIEPLDTGCDNSQVLWSETWAAGEAPASVWYFCGDLLDVEGDSQEQADARAGAGARQYLSSIGAQWPGAVGPDGFRWEVLHAPAGVEGEARFDHQYHRGNFAPTERYVQTLPGTVKHRLAADQSGLHNLTLAGDWTLNSFDIGAVEATVMSGMQAARAISGFPTHIAWDRHRWLSAG